MELKEIRNKANITQVEASNILGVPLRTFIRYEKEEKYSKTLKYQKMCDVLYQVTKIDEEHGLLTIDEIKKTCKEVFDRYDVEFAFLFGSYAKGTAVEMSDVDIMVCTEVTGLEFFGLIEELRESLHKKVDLIALNDIKQGSELMIEILRVGRKIYGK